MSVSISDFLEETRQCFYVEHSNQSDGSSLLEIVAKGSQNLCSLACRCWNRKNSGNKVQRIDWNDLFHDSM